MRDINTFKSAKRIAAADYNIDCALAGYTVPSRDFRASYKRSIRHARRALKASLRREAAFI